MKILHLCLAAFYIDNYSYQENMLPKYHRLMGHDVSVIASLVSFDNNGKECLLESAGEYFSNDGYRVKRLDYKKPGILITRTLRLYEDLYCSIEREMPDIIFIHGCQFWDIRQILRYVKKHKGIRIFIDNHADFINSATNWFSRNILHRLIWRYCAKIIEPYTEKFYGVTPLRCDFIKKVYKIPDKKIELLVLGGDDEKIDHLKGNIIKSRIRKLFNINEDDFVIISGGKIDRNKNIHYLMEAVLDIREERLKLLLFGNINDEMRQVIDNIGKSDRIINAGWIESGSIYDYFLASDLAAFPGTHSVLWEQSVSAGLPGIFKYWKGMDHIDLGGNCRFLYSDKVSEIKQVIMSIIQTDGVYDGMRKKAMEAGKTTFSYREIARRAIQ